MPVQGDDAEGLQFSEPIVRRELLIGSVGLSLAMLSAPAMAQIPGNTAKRAGGKSPSPARHGAAQMLDQIAVSQLILRERVAREAHDFDAEAACFTPDATVEVSWFKGTAKAFVDAARKAQAATREKRLVSFDSLSPPVVRINQTRAIAEGGCAIHQFLPIGGVDTSMTSFARLCWRLEKARGEWLIDRLSAIYIRDMIEPVVATSIPKLDQAKLSTYRVSYRHLSYILDAAGLAPSNDLPGVDRPDLVAAVHAAENAWLMRG